MFTDSFLHEMINTRGQGSLNWSTWHKTVLSKCVLNEWMEGHSYHSTQSLLVPALHRENKVPLHYREQWLPMEDFQGLAYYHSRAQWQSKQQPRTSAMATWNRCLHWWNYWEVLSSKHVYLETILEGSWTWNVVRQPVPIKGPPGEEDKINLREWTRERKLCSTGDTLYFFAFYLLWSLKHRASKSREVLIRCFKGGMEKDV